MFIYTALLEFLTCGETEIAAAGIRMAISKLRRMEPNGAITGFEKQFNVKFPTDNLKYPIGSCNVAKRRDLPFVALLGGKLHLVIKDLGLLKTDEVMRLLLDYRCFW